MIASILLINNLSVAFAEPVVYVGMLLLAVVRDASNKDNGDQDVATHQASERSTANAKCRVLDEDRKTFIEQLRRPECREAMVTATQNASVGEEAYLAVQQILYQSSENAALELVTLTVADDAAGDGDFDLPVPAGHDPFSERPHVAEDGGVELSVMMRYTCGPAAVSVVVPNDADQLNEQEPGDSWPSMLTCST